LFVPVPTQALRLGKARRGDGNRAWSAGAGPSALATGLVEVAWILAQLRRRCPTTKAHLDWSGFAGESGGLFLWEAFVSAGAKAATHVDDATIAASAFRDALPDPSTANAVRVERSELGAGRSPTPRTLRLVWLGIFLRAWLDLLAALARS
jgi:hypothetical protein